MLDNDLSPDIAQALRFFSFDIVHTSEVPEFQNRSEGVLDPEIITWCKDNKRAWITHDFKARRKHAEALKTARINVVWIRGKTEPKETTGESATWRFFKIIVRTIDEIQRRFSCSHGAIHFRINQKCGSCPIYEWADSSYDKPKVYKGHE